MGTIYVKKWLSGIREGVVGTNLSHFCLPTNDNLANYGVFLWWVRWWRDSVKNWPQAMDHIFVHCPFSKDIYGWWFLLGLESLLIYLEFWTSFFVVHLKRHSTCNYALLWLVRIMAISTLEIRRTWNYRIFEDKQSIECCLVQGLDSSLIEGD